MSDQPQPTTDQPTTDAPESAPPQETPEQARVAELEAQLADAQKREQEAEQRGREQALAQSSGAAPTSGPTVDLSGKDQKQAAEHYKDWPIEGGSDDHPQPWDHKAMGLQNAVRDYDDNAKPGSRNTVSPIVINHGKPILTSGSADPVVHELGKILGELGFENSVSRGENAFGSVDNTVMAAVHAFRDRFGVQEDPSGFGGNTPEGRQRAAAHIGPWTWEAILRVGKRLAADLVA